MKRITNKFYYLIFFVLITFIISFLSNYIILGNYESIEKKQNLQNISNTVVNLENYIKNIENTIFDHASWDDTYKFIQDLNPQYINSNFPVDGDTLENLNIDMLLFTTKENKIVYISKKSIYKEKNFSNLNLNILTKLRNTEDISTILKYNGKLFIIIKKPILKSDNTGEKKGFLYGIVSLKKNFLKSITRDFKNFEILLNNTNQTTQSPYLTGFFANTLNKGEIYLENNLNFFTKNKSFIFSLKLTNKRELYNEGKKVVLYFNIFASIFFIILVSILYKIQKIQNEKLKYKDEIKTKFLANMSHELRTPLNAINGFSELLIENEKDKKNLEYLHVMHSQAQHMLFMINDILDFSQIEENKLTIEKKSFNLEEELQNIIVFINFFSKKKDIDFSYSFYEIPTNIITDSVRLSQVLINLLNNAVKFTKSNGKIRLIVKYNKQDTKLYFEIQDNGIGIDEDKIDKVFNRFEQIDSKVTKEFEGTGLGLSISLVIVKLLGGSSIDINSKKDIGSTFSFSIPIEIDNTKQITQPTIEEPLNKYKNKHILLVEDNIPNQQFMSILFKKININFDIAQNGQIAIDKFKLKKYDLIFMDENMPVMSGIEATKNILNIEQKNNLKHTPIIALTANALKEDRDRFLKANLDEYLTKPIKKNRLIEILDQFIK